MVGTKLRAFLGGSITGWVLAAVLVLTESVNILEPPLWQKVLLYPGFIAGGAFFEHCSGRFSGWLGGEGPILSVGVLAVGIAYGAVAVALRALFARRAS